MVWNVWERNIFDCCEWPTAAALLRQGVGLGANVALIKLFQDGRIPVALRDQIGDNLSDRLVVGFR